MTHKKLAALALTGLALTAQGGGDCHSLDVDDTTEGIRQMEEGTHLLGPAPLALPSPDEMCVQLARRLQETRTINPELLREALMDLREGRRHDYDLLAEQVTEAYSAQSSTRAPAQGIANLLKLLGGDLRKVSDEFIQRRLQTGQARDQQQQEEIGDLRGQRSKLFKGLLSAGTGLVIVVGLEILNAALGRGDCAECPLCVCPTCPTPLL